MKTTTTGLEAKRRAMGARLDDAEQALSRGDLPRAGWALDQAAALYRQAKPGKSSELARRFRRVKDRRDELLAEQRAALRASRSRIDSTTTTSAALVLFDVEDYLALSPAQEREVDELAALARQGFEVDFYERTSASGASVMLRAGIRSREGAPEYRKLYETSSSDADFEPLCELLRQRFDEAVSGEAQS